MSVLWTILSFVAVVLAYFILFLGVSDTAVFKDLSEIVVLIAKNMEFDIEMAVVLFELALLVIVTLSNQYFQIYISMAVGYSSNTFQLAKSIGIYILISIVINIMQSFGYSLLVNLLAWWELSFFANTSITLGVNIVATVAITAVYYSITNYYLSNKLNLQ